MRVIRKTLRHAGLQKHYHQTQLNVPMAEVLKSKKTNWRPCIRCGGDCDHTSSFIAVLGKKKTSL
jgi:hypothetical protein